MPGFGNVSEAASTRHGCSRHPIQYYREKELETEVVCDNCTLRYAIYGVFAWCPDCGIHNSVQILMKNLELAKKEIALAESVDKEMADHLIGDALENVVSAFDGFGREICMRKRAEIRFQNLAGARRRVRESFGFDFADELDAAAWNYLGRIFLKRHLLAHKMGVIDADYVQKANDSEAVAGRKIRVSYEEVTFSIKLVETLGRSLFRGVLPAISELTAILLRGHESKDFDYKMAALWNETDKKACCELVKDILAMANTGGGFIVIGVSEPTTGFSLMGLLRLRRIIRHCPPEPLLAKLCRPAH
jgi:hypothetical protein